MIAILGAGRAARFGSGKLDADFRGQALGRYPLLAAGQLGDPVVYISGPALPHFLKDAGHGAGIAINPDPARGIGHSIALAAAQAQNVGVDLLLVMLGDMPRVSPDTLRRLRAATSRDGTAACCYPDARLGPPACFGRDHFAALQRLEGDHGARALLDPRAGTVVLDVDPAELCDVDTPEDLARLS